MCIRDSFWHALYLANASLAAFNLLPVGPLDGARALLAAAERLGVERPAQRLSLIHISSQALMTPMTASMTAATISTG